MQAAAAKARSRASSVGRPARHHPPALLECTAFSEPRQQMAAGDRHGRLPTTLIGNNHRPPEYPPYEAHRYRCPHSVGS